MRGALRLINSIPREVDYNVARCASVPTAGYFSALAVVVISCCSLRMQH